MPILVRWGFFFGGVPGPPPSLRTRNIKALSTHIPEAPGCHSRRRSPRTNMGWVHCATPIATQSLCMASAQGACKPVSPGSARHCVLSSRPSLSDRDRRRWKGHGRILLDNVLSATLLFKQASILVSRMMTKKTGCSRCTSSQPRKAVERTSDQFPVVSERSLTCVDSCWTAWMKPKTRRRTWWQS